MDLYPISEGNSRRYEEDGGRAIMVVEVSMSVLIEGISYVVPNRVLEDRYPGGDRGFLVDAPGLTRVSDGELACAMFMAPADVVAFDQLMVQHGIFCRSGGYAREAVVVDMLSGPERECRWLDFRIVAPDGQRVATARLRGGQDRPLVVPHGWTWEGSVTANAGFTREQDVPRELVYLRGDGRVDVYFDLRLGEVVTVPRAA